MDYGLTEQQAMIQELARKVSVEKVLPVRAELDEKEEFPYEPMKALAEADLFGIYLPEADGGQTLLIRKSTTPDPHQRALYDRLDIPHEVIRPRKTWILRRRRTSQTPSPE